MTNHRSDAGPRRGRRAGLGIALAGATVVLGLGGLTAAYAGTGSPDPGASKTPADAPKEVETSKPPVVVPSGPVEEPPAPVTEKTDDIKAPDPGPRPAARAGVKAPDGAAVMAAIAATAPALSRDPHSEEGAQYGKFMYHNDSARVSIDVQAGGTVKAEMRWAKVNAKWILAAGKARGMKVSTESRTLPQGAGAFVTLLPQGSEVALFTPNGLRVTVSVEAFGAEAAPSFSAEQAIALAQAIAGRG